MLGRLGTMCLLALGLFATTRVGAQPKPQPSPDIKVIGNYRATDPDGTMRVRCTVTEDLHVKKCENLSIDPRIAAMVNGGRSPELDAQVERLTPVASRRPGTQEFKIRFHSPPADAGTP